MPRYAVHIKLPTRQMTPCSIVVYVAFSYAAAHEFYAQRNYPASYSYFVREMRQAPDDVPLIMKEDINNGY